MLAHTKTPPTEARCTLRFVGPAAQINGARKAMEALGFKDITETVPWREAFAHLEDRPGKALVGARTKEGLTQVHLATMTGIPQRHISEMEHGKRPIGKGMAKRLAKVLKVHYQLLL
jgi:ribosome-binding protein aMBF1 (putative translation factor)